MPKVRNARHVLSNWPCFILSVLKRMQLGQRKALRLNAPQLDKLGEGYIGKTMDMPLPDIDSDHQTQGIILYSIHARWEVNKSIAIK